VQGRRFVDYKKHLQVWSESAVACDEEEEECSDTRNDRRKRRTEVSSQGLTRMSGFKVANIGLKRIAFIFCLIPITLDN
jgi:hypothetical protein